MRIMLSKVHGVEKLVVLENYKNFFPDYHMEENKLYK